MNGERWLFTTKVNIEHCIEWHVSRENYPDHLTTILSHCEKVTPESDCGEIWGRQEIFDLKDLNKQLYSYRCVNRKNNCPPKLSTKTLCIAIFILWTFAALLSKILTLLLVFTSFESALYVAVAVLLGPTIIICAYSIGIWIKLQRKIVFSQHQNKASRSRPPTKTLLFLSILDLLYVGSLITLNVLIDLTETSIPWKFYDMVNILNYSNSFVNPAVYAIRIPKFQQALCSCRKRGEQPLRRNRSKEEIERLHLERHW